MGLFDFLKPKGQDKGKPEHSPALRDALVTMELEYLQKQVGNLMAVGREEDAKKAMADFVTKYGKESAGKVCNAEELAQLCYAASYMYLPGLVFDRWPEFQELWSSRLPFPLHLSITVASRMKKRLSADQIFGFKMIQSGIGNDIDCCMIQFPEPRPQKESDPDAIEAVLAGKGGSIPILAPYFAVVSHRARTNERWLHVLGQSPRSGTTIRAVSGVGSHGNLGPGPDHASPQEFLRELQRFIK